MDRSREGPLAPHIAAVTLGVRDVRRSVDFYRALGLRPDVRSDARSAVFQLNGVLLQLVRRGIIAPEMAGGYPGEGMVALRHNVFTAGEVDAIIEVVTRAGGRVLRAPQAGYRSDRLAWFADPDGHRWEVAYDASLRRDKEGGVWLPPREVLSPVDGASALMVDDDTEDLGHALVTAEVPLGSTEASVAVVIEYDEVRPTVVVRDPVPPRGRSVRSQERAAAIPQKRARPHALPRPRPRAAPRPSGRSEPSVAADSRWTFGRFVGPLSLLIAFAAGSVLAWGLLQYALP